ncbi:MAG: glycosyltransferase family 4 protein, partial [Flavipsychrobacter sp.]
KIKKIINDVQPDMIIAERVTSYGFLAVITGFSCIAVAQQGITDAYPTDSILTPFKNLVQKFVFKKATLLHAWGSVMVPNMLANGAENEKILVLPKGIDLRKFHFNAEAKKWDKIRAVVTRSLYPEYGHEVIIKAFKKLSDNNIDFELVIIGDGNLKHQLQRLVSDLNLNQQISFTGRIKNDDLPQYLNAANIYISMPVTEGVSASLFEAMAAGCYPIVSAIPGNQAWIEDGKNGKLVTVNDANALFASLIDCTTKMSVIKDIVQNNRCFVEEEVSFEKNMFQIARLYDRLIKKNNS